MGMSRWCHSPRDPAMSSQTSDGPVPRRGQRQQASAATWPRPRWDDGPQQAAGGGEDYPRSRPRACAPGRRTGGPVAVQENERNAGREPAEDAAAAGRDGADQPPARSEEHTSELQSRFDLVCRLLLEKKKHEHLTHMLI